MTVSDTRVEHRDANDPPAPGRARTLRNGLVGGVVAVLLSVLPLSSALGGGVAGYLDRPAGRSGSTAGAIAGAVASLPYLLGGAYLALSPAIAVPGPDLGLSPGLVVAGVTSAFVVYVIGLSVLGGLLGGIVRDEMER